MQNPKQLSSNELCELQPKPNPTNLIINYLPRDITDEELTEMFSTFGAIRSMKIVRDTLGLCAGYGFVDFESSRCANTAVLLLNGRQLRDKRLKVAFALPRSSDIGKCNLFVKYLPMSVNEQELETLFEGYGKIWAVKILRDKFNGMMNRLSKIAYVRFRQPADAENARIALDGYRFPGATLPISVKTAKSLKQEDPKEDEAQAKKKNPSPQHDSKFGCATNSGTKCVCEIPLSPSPVPEVPLRPQGFIFPELD